MADIPGEKAIEKTAAKFSKTHLFLAAGWLGAGLLSLGYQIEQVQADSTKVVWGGFGSGTPSAFGSTVQNVLLWPYALYKFQALNAPAASSSGK